MNSERINADKFGEESISQFSTIRSMQFNQNSPNWVKISALVNQFFDETDFFQYGQEDEYELTQLNVENPQKSAWSTHPSVDPNGRYKFSSMDMFVDTRVLTFNRNTYDFFGFLGDVGGATDAVYIILNIMLLPITSFNLKSLILTDLFRLVPSRKSIAEEKY